MDEAETMKEGNQPTEDDPSPPEEGGTEEDVKAPGQDSLVPEEAERRISELEGTAEELKSRVTEQETQIGQLQSSLEEAVARYREGILRENPEIPGHLLTGSTAAELEASLEEARSVIERVKQHLEEQIPAGAPVRTGDDVSSLSPRQKIEYGVKHSKARKGN